MAIVPGIMKNGKYNSFRFLQLVYYWFLSLQFFYRSFSYSPCKSTGLRTGHCYVFFNLKVKINKQCPNEELIIKIQR